MRGLLLALLLLASASASGGECNDSVTTVKKNTVFRRIGRVFTKMFKSFNDVDTNYIEPQHYNYTVMLQNTNTYEIYKLSSKSGQSITFAPKPSVKIGPYIGWRWLFLGYTFDVKHISNGDKKKEFDLSLYSSVIGIDLYYRQTGNDYRIREAHLRNDVGKTVLKGVPFSGLSVGIKGFDVYYIFNHKRFSYPAAFSQSTRQKRSSGSALLGIGYTSHSIDLNYQDLKNTIDENLQKHGLTAQLDSGLAFNRVRYSSYSISGGYAYNWVFAKNWLLAASLSAAIAYKRSASDLEYKSGFSFRDFNFNDINIDGIGRFGLVWNNDKYYAGMSTILHSYNYKKSQFSTNNTFGSLNIYFGINIGRRKR